jgi:hypothetical protein
MKRLVAQAFQPAPGTAGGGCPPYRQELFKTVAHEPSAHTKTMKSLFVSDTLF